ncbi:MAG: VOC family protein [Myxococcota bacterium]|nr:VOC family protein [Myxococcota bacterium]
MKNEQVAWPRFHLAVGVTDLTKSRDFFVSTLGCEVGRTDERWIDFNFFGHQLTIHLVEESSSVAHNPVDGDQVPAFHFGVILDWDNWHKLRDRLLQEECSFLIEPHIRFEGQPGEQATLFIREPCGNALEFKSFRDMSMLFAT